MATNIAKMTTDELSMFIESIVERKLLEMIGDPDNDFKLKESVRNRLLQQKKAVAKGERGESFNDVVKQLELE